MHVIAVSSPAGTVWVVSKAVPRDADGEPVELGAFTGPRGDQREVLGEAKTVEQAIALIRDNGGEARVADVENAWNAAESGGPESDRRVKSRSSYAANQSAPNASNQPSTPPGLPGKAGPSPIVYLVIAALLAAAAYYFLKM